MLEYKVLTKRDKKLTGKFDPEVLEEALNAYAAEGWRLVEGVLSANPIKSGKTELVLILERQRDEATGNANADTR